MSRPGDVRRRLIVAGRVHGVGYRAACAARARSLGLDGHVRNLSDGTVEVVAEGDRSAVVQLTDWCRFGPPMAAVDDVIVNDQTVRGEQGFQVV